MAHSLILGREIELLGDGQMIDSGPATGAVIRLGGIGNTNLDLGAGEPQTTVITSLLLDGERPVGKRTGNATVELPIYVIAPGIPAVIAAREKVLEVVDQEIWEMVVTLEGLPPTVFDCLRAKVSMPTVLTHLQQDVCTFSISFQRLPFGRNDTQDTLTVLAPPGTPGGGGISVLPTLTFDTCESLSGGTVISGTSWTLTGNERYGSSGFQAITTAGASTYQRTVGPFNLTGYAAINFWAAIGGSRTESRTLTLTLFDNSGHTWQLPAKTIKLAPYIKYNWYGFSLKTVKPPQNFAIVSVTRYWIKTSGSIYLDDMTVVDGAVNVWGGTRGGTYQINAIEGSARCPVNIDMSRPDGSAMTSGLIHQPTEIPPDYTPIIQLNTAAQWDASWITIPNGSQLLTDRWRGTYSLVLSIGALLGGSTLSRTTQIGFFQYHPSGGGNRDTAYISRSYTPQEIGTAKYLYIGRVTLPLRDIPTGSVGAEFHVSISQSGLPAGTYDSFTDLLILDAEGTTIIWQNTLAYSHVFIDEPDPVFVNRGRIMNGANYTGSESIMDKITGMSGPPIGFNPGSNALVAHCWEGATRLTINYSPRWHGLRPTQ